MNNILQIENPVSEFYILRIDNFETRKQQEIEKIIIKDR